MFHGSGITIGHLYSNPLVDINFQSSDGNHMVPVECLDHQQEYELLSDIVDACQDLSRVTLHSVPATVESFQSCFRYCKILHFSGHGLPYFLCFEEDGKVVRVAADELRNMCSDSANKPMIVFLSACYAKTIANIFIEIGVPYVISVTESSVNDEGSVAFAKSFYHALLMDGLEVPEAFTSAQHSCKMSIHESVQSISTISKPGNRLNSSAETKFVLLQGKCVTDTTALSNSIDHFVYVNAQTNRDSYVNGVEDVNDSDINTSICGRGALTREESRSSVGSNWSAVSMNQTCYFNERSSIANKQDWNEEFGENNSISKQTSGHSTNDGGGRRQIARKHYYHITEPTRTFVGRQVDIYDTYTLLKLHIHTGAALNSTVEGEGENEGNRKYGDNSSRSAYCRIINLYGERGVGKSQVAFKTLEYIIERGKDRALQAHPIFSDIYCCYTPSMNNILSNTLSQGQRSAADLNDFELTLEYEWLLELAYALKIPELLLYDNQLYSLSSQKPIFLPMPMESDELPTSSPSLSRSPSLQSNATVTSMAPGLLSNGGVSLSGVGKARSLLDSLKRFHEGYLKDGVLTVCPMITAEAVEDLLNQILSQLTVYFGGSSNINRKALLYMDGVDTCWTGGDDGAECGFKPSGSNSSEVHLSHLHSNLNEFFLLVLHTLLNSVPNLSLLVTSTNLIDFHKAKSGFSRPHLMNARSNFQSKSKHIETLSNIEAAELLSLKVGRELELGEMGFELGMSVSPVECLSKSPVLRALKGNPGIIVEFAKTLVNEAGSVRYHLLRNQKQLVQEIIPRLCGQAISTGQTTEPSLPLPPSNSSVSGECIKSYPWARGKEGLCIALLPAVPNVKYPRNAAEWGVYIQTKVLTHLKQEESQKSSEGIYDCPWSADHNDMLNVELLHHAHRIQKSIHATCNMKLSRNSIDIAKSFFTSSDLIFFKQNIRIWPSDKLKKLSHPLKFISWELFHIWFAWFHESIIVIVVASLGVELKTCPITYGNHAQMTRKLSQDLAPGSFVLCCSESRPALVVVYVDVHRAQNMKPTVAAPVQLFLRVNSRAVVPIPIYSSPEIIKFQNKAIQSPDITQCTDDIIPLELVFECNGANPKAVNQYHSFEELITSIDSITHLYPGIPKDSLFL